MARKQPDFTMDAPAPYGRSSDYAFWMTTSDRKLLMAVRGMGCVVGMKRSRLTGRILVEISDDHDPDEAWHWIRKEIEDTINEVELDDIWIEAIKWIL
jgi:hypothetical protein